MSIEKKSLISNRIATKKANLTEVNATHVATTKLARPAASSRAAVTAAKSMTAPRVGVRNMSAPRIAVRNMAAPRIAVRNMAAPKLSIK